MTSHILISLSICSEVWDVNACALSALGVSIDLYFSVAASKHTEIQQWLTFLLSR